ncbi:MAG: hypothetical protein OEV49_05555 [candidate division Zixibacteria bacterium]|nr:hypothetical protein [candidate division Zixibacteria bacterium]MDH3936229.1 hypothetical protein [candidate division Zixibacteria bacterium]MDH4032747.1 hypothetical protein [candidate division Zixibacteria bacterium]
MFRPIVICGVAVFLLAVAALAISPTAINYQGRLTDAVGDPVADDKYSVTFTIYDADADGNSKWTETQSVDVVDGLFSVLLGSGNPILDTVFNGTERYLGIQVGANPEGTPRVKLVTVPYAFHANKADSARYADNAVFANNADLLDGMNSTDFLTGAHDHDEDYVNVTGDEMTGPLGFHNGTTPMTYIYHAGVTNPPRAVVAHSPGFPDWGLMYDDVGDEFVFTGNGDTNMVVKPNGDGDNAVRLGESSINALEMFNEPGLSGDSAVFVTLPYRGVGFRFDTVITSTTIVAPSDGFVFVIGSGQVTVEHTTSGVTESWARISVGKNGPGDPIDQTNLAFFKIGFRTANGSFQSPFSVTAVDAVTAGSHTYYLRGAREDNTVSSVGHTKITAMFFPTAYGTVNTTMAPPAQTGGSQEATN